GDSIGPKCKGAFTMIRVLAVLTVAAYAIPFQGAALEAGAAKESIVPPFPTTMGGYFDRHETFTRANTPLYVRTLMCRDGGVTLVLSCLDLIGISNEAVEAAKKRIQAEAGIAPEQVMISATHDHSAPSGFAGMTLAGEPDKQV